MLEPGLIRAGHQVLMRRKGQVLLNIAGHRPVLVLHGLEEAKQLLESGDTPIEAVAFDVGYSDSSFFTRLFKRKVGMTPARYRQRFGRLAREIMTGAGSSG